MAPKSAGRKMTGGSPAKGKNSVATAAPEHEPVKLVWPAPSLEVSPAPELLPMDELSFGNMHVSIEWLLRTMGLLLVDYKETARQSQTAGDSLVERLSLVEDVITTAPWKAEEVPTPAQEEILGDDFWSKMPIEASEDALTPPITPQQPTLPVPVEEGVQVSRVPTPLPPPPPPLRLLEPMSKHLEGVEAAEKAAAAITADLPDEEKDPQYLAEMFRALWDELGKKASIKDVQQIEASMLQKVSDMEAAIAAQNSESDAKEQELREMVAKIEQTAFTALEKGKAAEGVMGSVREAVNRLGMAEERIQQISDVVASQEAMHQKLKQHGASALEALLKIDMAEEVRRLRSHVEIMEQDASMNAKSALDVLRSKEASSGGGVARLMEASGPASSQGLSSIMSPKAKAAHTWGGLRSAMTLTGNIHHHPPVPLSKTATIRRDSQPKLESKPASRGTAVSMGAPSPTTDADASPSPGDALTMDLSNVPSMAEEPTASTIAGEDTIQFPEEEMSAETIAAADLEHRLMSQTAEVREILKRQEAFFEKQQSVLNKAVRDTQRETDLIKARVAHMWEERYHVVTRRQSDSRGGSRAISTPPTGRKSVITPPPPPATAESLPPAMERAVLDLVQDKVIRTMESITGSAAAVSDTLTDLLKDPGQDLFSEADPSSFGLSGGSPGATMTSFSSGRRLLPPGSREGGLRSPDGAVGGSDPASNSASKPDTAEGTVVAADSIDGSTGAGAQGAAGVESAPDSLRQTVGSDRFATALPELPADESGVSLNSAVHQLMEAHSITHDRCKQLGTNQGKLAEALQKTQQSLALQLSKHAAQLLSLSNRLDAWAQALPPPMPPAGGGPLGFGRVPSPGRGRKRMDLEQPELSKLTPFGKHMVEECRKGHENCKRQINVKSLEASKSVGRLPHLRHTKENFQM